MRDIWNQLENWLSSNAPEKKKLPPAVTLSEMNEFEDRIGKTLPKDFRESFLIHDGTSLMWLLDYGYLMPLVRDKALSKRKAHTCRSITEKWTWLKDYLDDGIFDEFQHSELPETQRVHWSDSWIPITDNEAGDQLFMDLAPSSKGTMGQILFWDHEVGPTHLVATSFRDWLLGITKELESDNCEFIDHGDGTISLKNT